MSEYNTKNYTEQGGEVTHINVSLVVGPNGSVSGMPLASGTVPGTIKAEPVSKGGAAYTVEVKIDPETGKLYVPAHPVANPVTQSNATTVADLKNSFNALLTSLTACGLMAESGSKN